MNLVYLSDDDINEALSLFTEFHENYAPFFQNGTKSVAKSAKDYVHGQLFTKQVSNLYFRTFEQKHRSASLGLSANPTGLNRKSAKV